MQGADQLSEAQLSTLDTSLSGDDVFVSKVDGISRGVGLFDTFKLVPGERVITVSGNSQLGLYRKYTDIVFNAEPGGNYQLSYMRLGGGDWLAVILNSTNGSRVDYEQSFPKCELSMLGSYECVHKKHHLNKK
jgi:hypothetical protein